ncbi:MAG: ketopantoate reductase family protein [Halobacteriota archaeon]
MRVCIFGTGGVGGYLGARLAEAGHDVHFIARGDHLEAIRRDGLVLESVFGDVTVDPPATADPAEVGPCDIVPFCVKAYDTVEAAAQLAPLVGAQTAVVSFQNGIDNERHLAAAIGEAHVAGGVARIFSTIARPGVVAHTGGPASFTFGELDGRESDRLAAFEAALEGCRGVDPTLTTDIHVELWRKLAFICAQSGMTAATGRPIGDIRSSSPTWSMYRRVVEEVVTVAGEKGIDLDADEATALLEFAEGLDAEMRSSLAYDREHGNPLEIETLCGAVTRHAEDAGVDVPMNEALYAVLAPDAGGRAR